MATTTWIGNRDIVTINAAELTNDELVALASSVDQPALRWSGVKNMSMLLHATEMFLDTKRSHLFVVHCQETVFSAYFSDKFHPVLGRFCK